jgi:hypothetical protein
MCKLALTNSVMNLFAGKCQRKMPLQRTRSQGLSIGRQDFDSRIRCKLVWRAFPKLIIRVAAAELTKAWISAGRRSLRQP